MSRKLNSTSTLFAVILLIVTAVSTMAQHTRSPQSNTNEVLAAANDYWLNPVPMANPTFDVSGRWKGSAGDEMQIFQEKDEVNAIFVNAGWAHRLAGRYVSPTKIRMVMIRRTRADGCETTMTVDLDVNSANSLSGTGVASETACGLTAGQTFPGTWTRIL